MAMEALDILSDLEKATAEDVQATEERIEAAEEELKHERKRYLAGEL